MLRPVARDTLINHPAFTSLPPRLRDTLQSTIQPIRLPAGHVLFDLDSPCLSFLVIESGSICVTKPIPNGREILLYRLKPGDSCILTVSCLLGGAAYSARGVAESDVTGVGVPRPVFLQLLNEAPAFREPIFHFFGERFVELMQLIEEVAFRPLDQRVANALLAQADAIETTHQRLADELGTVREVISRILKDFEAQGLVQLARGRIVIIDRDGLALVSDWSH